MEDVKEFLMSIGLGKNEAEVYLSLVKRGLCSAVDISKNTGIHRSNIYSALDTLLNRGLIFKISKDKKSMFYARPPASLRDYLKNRELELDNIIERMQSENHPQNVESNVKLSQGTFAMREALASMLEIGQPICVYGIPQRAPEIIGPMLKDFHQKRIEKKIPMRHIYNKGGISNGDDRVTKLNQMPFTEAKHLPMKYDSPVSTNICGNKVILFIWNADNNTTVIEIESSEVAKAYQNYFELIWKLAKLE